MAVVILDTPRSHPNRKGKWSHLVASDIKTLHSFAEKIGLKKCWFQNKKNKKQPHYDLKESLLNKAISNGAILVSRSELFMFLQHNYS